MDAADHPLRREPAGSVAPPGFPQATPVTSPGPQSLGPAEPQPQTWRLAVLLSLLVFVLVGAGVHWFPPGAPSHLSRVDYLRQASLICKRLTDTAHGVGRPRSSRDGPSWLLMQSTLGWQAWRDLSELR